MRSDKTQSRRDIVWVREKEGCVLAQWFSYTSVQGLQGVFLEGSGDQQKQLETRSITIIIIIIIIAIKLLLCVTQY